MMSFKRDAVAPAVASDEEEDEEEGDQEAKPQAKGDVFRRPSSEVTNAGNGGHIPLHSGLSALIQAATTQLGQLDDGAATSSTSITPRYTPHGFGSITAPYNALAASPPVLQTTPTLGPETASAAELRQQNFPEILMTVLEDKLNADVGTFLPDGKFFAVRRKDFSEKAMLEYFAVASFDEFLEKIHSWGFYRIERPDASSGIEVFRHPMFVKGDWDRCSRICFGESPTDARLSALPDRARIEYTLSDETTLQASKRRLSPSHVNHVRRGSESSFNKQRMASSDIEVVAISKSESADTASTDASALYNIARSPISANGTASPATPSRIEDDIRSLALAITTDKLNLKTDVDDHEEASTPLVEKAVENATCTIVTDAIETLLRDEGHTRETFLKHEQELSRSSLPGVVPISKQLFAAKLPSEIQEQLLKAAAAAAKVITICDSNGEQKAESKQQEGKREDTSGENKLGTTTEPIKTNKEEQTPGELTSARDEGAIRATT